MRESKVSSTHSSNSFFVALLVVVVVVVVVGCKLPTMNVFKVRTSMECVFSVVRMKVATGFGMYVRESAGKKTMAGSRKAFVASLVFIIGRD